MTLTPAAMTLLEKFRRLEKDADSYLKKTSRELTALLDGEQSPDQEKKGEVKPD